MAPRFLPTSLRPVLISLTLLLGAAACAPAATDVPASIPASASPSANTPSAAATADAAFPVTVTDDAGRTVTIDAAPDRVVSLAPSNTEIVCALDACHLLVGVTDFDDYPPEVADLPKVVTAAQVDVEAVVATDADLVLAAGNELTPTSVIDQLAGLGLPVLTLYPESLEEVYADIELIGAALDRARESADLVDDLAARVEAVRSSVDGLARPRTFYEVGVFEGVIYTAGEDSFLASLVETAGGEPITGDALSTAIELEDLVAADPELILLGDASYDATITPESVAARPGWEGMTAVTDGRVVVYADDLVTTRPGPRIVDGLEALADAIHPDRGSD